MTQKNKFQFQQPQTPQSSQGFDPRPVIDPITTEDIQDKIRTHIHDGTQAPRINLNTDITGLFEVVSAVPAGLPRDLFDQVKIYTNAGTYRLYWYDHVNGAWHYAVGV